MKINSRTLERRRHQAAKRCYQLRKLAENAKGRSVKTTREQYNAALREYTALLREAKRREMPLFR
ncbi:MAG: hypothetical protein KGR26_00365 [Cyanobacteria bacterium REEB65]|nr:hypothetical protein [Cyanobacteria bacterium REEB65]